MTTPNTRVLGSSLSGLALALLFGAALSTPGCINDDVPSDGAGGRGGSSGGAAGAGSPAGPSVGPTEVCPKGAAISDGVGNEVVVPAGAIPKNMTLEIRVVPESPPTAPPNGLEHTATYVLLTPHGTTFSEDVTVTLQGVGETCRVFRQRSEIT